MKFSGHVIGKGPDFTTSRRLGLPSEAAVLSCECGHSTTVADWPAHVRSEGQGAGSTTDYRATDQSAPKGFSFGRQKYRKDEA